MPPIIAFFAIEAIESAGLDTRVDEADVARWDWMTMRNKLGFGSMFGMVLLMAACDTDDGGKSESASNAGTASEPGDTEGDTEGDTDTAAEPESTTTTGEPEPESCDVDGATRVCAVEGGVECGEQRCDAGLWGACLETELCGGGEETSTPLVLSFDGAEPRLGAAAAAAFDIDVAGGCVSTDWPTSSTPWLALDRNGDGGIADGRELFGSGSRLATGRRAANGFTALAELDADGNGKITATDPGFAELVLWADHDGDKRGTAGELQSLSALRVLSIELAYDVDAVCDARGNCGVERAVFSFIGRGGAIEQGRVIDLHLACQ